jgi:hypothetical protein
MVRFETALMTVDQVDTTQRNGRTWTGRPTGEGRIQVRGHFQWIAPTKLVLFMNIKAPVFFWGALFTPHILNIMTHNGERNKIKQSKIRLQAGVSCTEFEEKHHHLSMIPFYPSLRYNTIQYDRFKPKTLQ